MSSMQLNNNAMPVPRDIAVQARGIGKCFKLYPSPWARLIEWSSFGKACRHQDFWALRGVNFSITRGQSLGIIGVNGSGKSTLLKILTGCTYASEGEFQVCGRVLSLLELGTGMNSMLTGRQNVINSSQLLALPPGYAQDKMPVIEAFAELGDFFDQPIRLYSTGMMMRLAFSAFVAFDPDVFIIDEALSVGDIFFQQKCAQRIEQLRERGTTLLFVSHDLAAVEKLCDQVLVLHKSKQEHFGDKIRGINLYYSLSGIGLPTLASEPNPLPAPRERTPSERNGKHLMKVDPPSATDDGDSSGPLPPLDENEIARLPWAAPNEADKIDGGQIRIDAICIRRADGESTPIIEQGKCVDIFARLVASTDVGPVNMGMSLYDRFNHVAFAQGWLNVPLEPLWIRAGQTVYARFRVRMDLEWGGVYALTLAASEALPDPQSPTGWNQSAGGAFHMLLPRCAVLTVMPPASNLRGWFGPANLPTVQDRLVIEPAIAPVQAMVLGPA